MKKSVRVTPMTDESNLLGRLYAETLRSRAKALRTPLVLSKAAKEAIAADLEALAAIAERRPDAFGCLTLTDMPTPGHKDGG